MDKNVSISTPALGRCPVALTACIREVVAIRNQPSGNSAAVKVYDVARTLDFTNIVPEEQIPSAKRAAAILEAGHG